MSEIIRPDFTPLSASLWSGIFGNERPVAVEIGPGEGEFLEFAARREPNWNFFAVEHLASRTRIVQRRIDESKLANARVLCASAECVLTLLPDACVDRFHIQFPDPWWKRRHHRRRLMKPALVAQLRRTLRPGATIEFITDVEEYFHLSIVALDGDSGLVAIDKAPDLPTTTSFSRKAAARGWKYYASTHRRLPARG